jgi:hypothetical protein
MLHNKITLESLNEDPDFREFWAGVLKGIHAFRLNEAVLELMYRAAPKAGNADELNKAAAIEFWQTQGALMLWENLLNNTGIAAEKVKAEDNVNYDGEL